MCPFRPPASFTRLAHHFHHRRSELCFAQPAHSLDQELALIAQHFQCNGAGLGAVLCLAACIELCSQRERGIIDDDRASRLSRLVDPRQTLRVALGDVVCCVANGPTLCRCDYRRPGLVGNCRKLCIDLIDARLQLICQLVCLCHGRAGYHLFQGHPARAFSA